MTGVEELQNLHRVEVMSPKHRSISLIRRANSRLCLKTLGRLWPH
jgi:hypothetical protein